MSIASLKSGKEDKPDVVGESEKSYWNSSVSFQAKPEENKRDAAQQLAPRKSVEIFLGKIVGGRHDPLPAHIKEAGTVLAHEAVNHLVIAVRVIIQSRNEYDTMITTMTSHFPECVCEVQQYLKAGSTCFEYTLPYLAPVWNGRYISLNKEELGLVEEVHHVEAPGLDHSRVVAERACEGNHQHRALPLQQCEAVLVLLEARLW